MQRASAQLRTISNSTLVRSSDGPMRGFADGSSADQRPLCHHLPVLRANHEQQS